MEVQFSAGVIASAIFVDIDTIELVVFEFAT